MGKVCSFYLCKEGNNMTTDSVSCANNTKQNAMLTMMRRAEIAYIIKQSCVK